MICCQHIKILRILTKGPAFHFVLDSTNDGASPGYGVRTLVLEGDPVEELRTQMHEVTDMIINTLQSEPWGHEQVQAGLEQFEVSFHLALPPQLAQVQSGPGKRAWASGSHVTPPDPRLAPWDGHSGESRQEQARSCPLPPPPLENLLESVDANYQGDNLVSSKHRLSPPSPLLYHHPISSWLRRGSPCCSSILLVWRDCLRAREVSARAGTASCPQLKTSMEPECAWCQAQNPL
ncbi:uncharacterized protein LOC126086740 isoform X2 [Elephas maximus indicus]|uniref:uncharacterized protein LOC126086740 isoform X2 n=1 Tax=Elephas maximus indicus TaxID=99487 RepID=UPI00211621E8|nr:uncharacterized protein LOC126086740 isoform X2 [Elephas maximus indicus]